MFYAGFPLTDDTVPIHYGFLTSHAAQGHQIRHRYGRMTVLHFELCLLIQVLQDRGGTFTDVWASIDGQPDIVLKLLSVDPDNYADAPSEG